MIKHLMPFAAALAFVPPAIAQDEPAGAPSPNEIVAQADANEWLRIAPEDLLVMRLADDADGNERTVVIQLMPPPFSQGWVQNIRTLARAGWYDDITVNRVQDNYVVQWGDPNYDNPEAEGEAKALPEGLLVMDESDYLISDDALGKADAALSDARAQVREGTGGEPPELTLRQRELRDKVEQVFRAPNSTEEEYETAIEELLESMGLVPGGPETAEDNPALISIETTRKPHAMEGWHQRDSYAEWVEFWQGWPIANEETGIWFDENNDVLVHLPSGADRHDYYREVTESWFWPVHCYGMVGVGRGYSPDTGSGAELYTVIGQAPRHLDRNIALVGRVIAGIEHLTSLPRGSGALGFYAEGEFHKRAPILTVRVASDLPPSERPAFEYLRTKGASFERYVEARANRRDPFFIHPAGGADICNIPVPVRRVSVD